MQFRIPLSSYQNQGEVIDPHFLPVDPNGLLVDRTLLYIDSAIKGWILLAILALEFLESL
jgi:hypothetical protein